MICRRFPCDGSGRLPVPTVQAAAKGMLHLVPGRGARRPLPMQTDPGYANAEATTGLVAYLDEEPVGWCAVEPRPAYISMVRGGRVAWKGRSEDRTDVDVWAVTCFITRAGFRRRGISRALARAAVDYARGHGARAVEGYPLTTTNAVADELHVGFESTFAAGFTEVSRPSPRRVVMRIDV